MRSFQTWPSRICLLTLGLLVMLVAWRAIQVPDAVAQPPLVPSTTAPAASSDPPARTSDPLTQRPGALVNDELKPLLRTPPATFQNADPFGLTDLSDTDPVIILLLKNVPALNVQDVLKKVYGNSNVEIVAESVSNRLILRGNPKLIAEITELVKVLDEPVKSSDQAPPRLGLPVLPKSTSPSPMPTLRNAPSSTGKAAPAKPSTDELKVFTLLNSAAEELRAVLSDLFGPRVKIVADSRTNSLIVNGSQEDLNAVEAIALRLDAAKSANPPKLATAPDRYGSQAAVSAAPAPALSTAASRVAKPLASSKDQQKEAESFVYLKQLQAAEKAGNQSEASNLRGKLTNVLREVFELRQAQRRAEVAELKKKLAEVEKTLQTREEAKERIIDRRMNELLGSDPSLQWDPAGSSGSLPALFPNAVSSGPASKSATIAVPAAPAKASALPTTTAAQVGELIASGDRQREQAALEFDLKEAELAAQIAERKLQAAQEASVKGVMPKQELDRAKADAELAKLKRDRAATMLKLLPDRGASSVTGAASTSGTSFPTPVHSPLTQLGPAHPAVLAAQAARDAEQAILELDLKEAEVHLRAAMTELERGTQLHSSASISATELDQLRLKSDLAKLQVERASVKLESFKKQNAPRLAPPAKSGTNSFEPKPKDSILREPNDGKDDAKSETKPR